MTYYTELERTGCHQRLLQFQPLCALIFTKLGL